MPLSPRFELIQVRLGRDLTQYVRERRPDAGWRTIAADLRTITGVEVSYETLRAWFKDTERAA